MSLEGEALLVGTWKNVEEIEEYLTLEELELLVRTRRKDKRDDQRFYAAFKGVDLDEDEKQSQKDRFEAIEKRALAKARGITDEEAEKEDAMDFSSFGFEVEVID